MKSKQPPAAPRPVPPADLETYAEVGDVVNWYAGGQPNEEPKAGLMTQVGGDGQSTVNVFDPLLQATVPQGGCLHVSHPNVRKDWHESGGWTHRPLTVATRRMLVEMGALVWDGKGRYVMPAPPAAEASPA